jgi:phage shock protein A
MGLLVFGGAYGAIKTMSKFPNSPFGRMANSVLDNLNWFSHSTKASAIKRGRRLIDEEKAKLPQYMEQMAKFMAQVKRLERIVMAGRENAANLMAQARNLVPVDEDRARVKFSEYQTAQRDLERNERDLVAYQQSLADAKQRLGQAQEKIRKAEDDLKSLGARLEITEFRADMARMSGGLDPNAIGASLDQLSEIHDSIQSEIDEAEASVDLNSEFGQDLVQEEKPVVNSADFDSFAASVRGHKIPQITDNSSSNVWVSDAAGRMLPVRKI